jgi:hypothetical protein
MRSQNTTPSVIPQIPHSQQEKLSDLGEAKFRLQRYRERSLGRGQTETVGRLLDCIMHLEACEGLEA